MKENLIPYYKWCYGKFILVGYINQSKSVGVATTIKTRGAFA